LIIASCPLRVSLFGGSTDNPLFVETYGHGSVISFTCSLRTYVTISQDKIGRNHNHKYIINYSRREEVSSIDEIDNEVVRVVLQHFDMPPVHVTLTSDAFSQGSGLASSSSYLISLIKACLIFKGKAMTDVEICRLAYGLELQFNPYCGYQDPFGCGVGGFKKIDFYGINKITYEFLSTELFYEFDTHLIFTGITRNSKTILKKVSGNLEKVKPLLKNVDHAYDALSGRDFRGVMNEMNKSWKQKKKTSSSITENPVIQEMDKELSQNKTVLSHKLCGAGNGGFFLTFSKQGTLNVPYDCVSIDVTASGVYGKSV